MAPLVFSCSGFYFHLPLFALSHSLISTEIDEKPDRLLLSKAAYV